MADASHEPALARWLTAERIRVYPAMIGGLTALGWLGSISMGDGLHDAAGTPIGADFLAFFTGGRLWLDSRAGELYDFGAQQGLQTALMGPGTPLCPFLNPPHAAVLYAPFAAAGYLPGLLGWWALCGLGLLVAVARLRAELGLRGSTALWTARALMFFPVLAAFLFGQVAPLLVLPLSGFLLALRADRDLEAGAWLGLLALKPQLGLGWAVVLVASGRWRAVSTAALVVGAQIALGLLAAPEATAPFLAASRGFLDLLARDVYPTWGLSNALALCVLGLGWASDRLALEAWFGLSAALLWTVGFAGWRAMTGDPAHRDGRLATCVALSLLVSPHLYFYDLALLVPAFALAGAAMPVRDRRPFGGGPVLVWTAILYVCAFVGPYLTLAQVRLTDAAFGVEIAVPIVVPALIGWAGAVWSAASRG